MQKRQEKDTLLINSLIDKIAVLENNLADKDSIILDNINIISERDSEISNFDTILIERDSSISRLTADLEASRFQNEQLRRMIFGSKRERFVPMIDSEQLSIEFEPKAAEIAEAVKIERELIRVAYQRKKPKKEHHGRMALPSHLPVVEIVIEPSEDTTNMVCIGKEITEELDYTPAKLHINRIVRPR